MNKVKQAEQADEHEDGATQYLKKGTADARPGISGEISVKSIPELLAAYQAAQVSSNSQNNHVLLINWLTFAAVVAYTSVAALQWCATNKQAIAAEQANKLLEESTRARLSLHFKLDPVSVGNPINITISVKNAGHMITSYRHAYGHMIGRQMPSGKILVMQNGIPTWIDAGEEAFAGATDATLATQEFLDNLPKITDRSTLENTTPDTPTAYLYGIFDYESLGQPRHIEWCEYIVQNNSPNMIPAGSGLKDTQFILRDCPKWNSSD